MKFNIGGGNIHQYDAMISRTIKETLAKVGMPDLKITWEWNSKFTRRMGDAHSATRIVRFSTHLWPRASEAERWETVVHEVCHITADIRHGKDCMHGIEWVQEMQRAGIKDPQRCHEVDRSGIAQKRALVAAKCPCGKIKKIGAGRAGRLRNGTRIYHCKDCNGKVELL